MIHFEIPKNQSSIIKVIGIGGGGGNAVNYMHSLGIESVDFVVCNTDSQALTLSPVHNKIQLGPHLTQGLGAGANPEIGKQASEESLEDITKILEVNTRMAFITAGMGGGTGTGGAPVLAKICRDLGILTVGIVTTPFTYEGRKRMRQAQEGIERMREHVDTILIISNDKLRQQYGNLPFTQAFAQADNVLATAAKCITDVIDTTGQINVDFADVCTVMKNGGVAILGSASVDGENRAQRAVEEALNSPLLNDNDITGAKWILLNITSAAGDFEHTMDEAEAIQAYVQQQAGEDCDVILGMGHDPNLEEKIAVTVIATGFNHKDINAEMPARKNEPEKIVVKLGDDPADALKSETKQEEPKEEKPVEDTMSPKLVEVQEQRNPVQIDAKPQFPKQEDKEKEVTPLVMPQDENTEPVQPEAKQEEPKEEKKEELKLVIKNEDEVKQPQEPQQPQAQQPAQAQSQQPTYGQREMTAMELEEKRQFEEQKRALEERAERLRRMSFDVKSSESGDDVENVPAYVRKNIKIDDRTPSADEYYSGYSVGKDEDKKEENANIQSLNTFLQGKKPD